MAYASWDSWPADYGIVHLVSCHADKIGFARINSVGWIEVEYELATERDVPVDHSPCVDPQSLGDSGVHAEREIVRAAVIVEIGYTAAVAVRVISSQVDINVQSRARGQNGYGIIVIRRSRILYKCLSYVAVALRLDGRSRGPKCIRAQCHYSDVNRNDHTWVEQFGLPNVPCFPETVDHLLRSAWGGVE